MPPRRNAVSGPKRKEPPQGVSDDVLSISGEQDSRDVQRMLSADGESEDTPRCRRAASSDEEDSRGLAGEEEEVGERPQKRFRRDMEGQQRGKKGEDSAQLFQRMLEEHIAARAVFRPAIGRFQPGNNGELWVLTQTQCNELSL